MLQKLIKAVILPTSSLIVSSAHKKDNGRRDPNSFLKEKKCLLMNKKLNTQQVEILDEPEQKA